MKQTFPHLALATALCGALLASPLRGVARAERCATPVGASSALAEQDAEARLQYLISGMHEVGRKERLFLIGWSLAYAGMAGGTWMFVPLSSDPRQWVSSTWNSSTAVAGGLLGIIQPLRVLRAEKRAAALATQPGPLCTRLAAAEQQMSFAARNEAGARSPSSHTLAILTGVSLGLFLTYVLKQPKAAMTSIPVGTVITELQILTRPQTALRRFDSYLRGNLTLVKPPPPKVTLIPLLSPIDGGLGVGLGGAF